MNPRLLKLLSLIVLMAGLILSSPSKSYAGFFDALNDAANKLNQAAQQMDQKAQSNDGSSGSNGADADHPLTLQYHGSCDGHRTATCMDYNEGMDQCMAPIRGYRMKMLGDRIEYKFKNDSLNDQQRKNLQEDLDGARQAQQQGSDDPTIAGQPKSQRYLSDISEEDQVWVNAEFMRLRNRIYNKCEGADHMGVGHRTELITDFGPTGDEAVEQYRKQHRRAREDFFNRAHGGGSNCMQQVSGLRYQIMADMMEKKMNSLNPSGKDRDDWITDIAAVRASAASGGTQMPKVDGATNPYRPLTRLSSADEQTALNNEFSSQSRAMMQSCNR